jgi:hypothetical protein
VVGVTKPQPWGPAELRCENCGKAGPTTLCPSCAHKRKKDAARAAAQEAENQSDSATAPSGPDLDQLRERLRRVQEGLTEPS